jgi:hypothetical protein
MGDFLESIVWFPLDDSKDNSYHMVVLKTFPKTIIETTISLLFFTHQHGYEKGY